MVLSKVHFDKMLGVYKSIEKETGRRSEVNNLGFTQKDAPEFDGLDYDNALRYVKKNEFDLKGKRVLITGANTGIGLACARIFASLNCELIITCRSKVKLDETLKLLRVDFPKTKFYGYVVDFSTFDDIKRCSKFIIKDYNSIDILVNNVGIMATPFKQNEQGIEMQFLVNHLSVFTFTSLLLPLLKKSTGSRIIVQSSIAARKGDLSINSIDCKDSYVASKAYEKSKLANLVFSQVLAKKLSEYELDIKSIAVHPGVIRTNLFKFVEEKILYRTSLKVLEMLPFVMQKSVFDAALPVIYAACSSDAVNGGFYGPDGFLSTRGLPIKLNVFPSCSSNSQGQELWDESEKLSGVKFDFS